jgi:lipopolysaccharide transport system ATP-binding protein
LCTRGIVVEHGKVVFEGGIDDAIENYLNIDLDTNTKFESSNENKDTAHIKAIEIITNRNEYYQDYQSDFKIKFILFTPKALIEPAISYQIVNANEEPILHELNLNSENEFCNEEGFFEVISDIEPLNLYPGVYKVNAFFADNFLKIKYDSILNACCFEVLLTKKRDYYFQKGSAIYKEKNTSWKIKKI